MLLIQEGVKLECGYIIRAFIPHCNQDCGCFVYDTDVYFVGSKLDSAESLVACIASRLLTFSLQFLTFNGKNYWLGFSFAILIPKLITGSQFLIRSMSFDIKFRKNCFCFSTPVWLVVLDASTGGRCRCFTALQPSIARDLFTILGKMVS